MVAEGPQRIPDIREAGLRALMERLGPSGAIQFLHDLGGGRGDYTAERQALVGHLSVQDVIALARAQDGGSDAPDDALHARLAADSEVYAQSVPQNQRLVRRVVGFVVRNFNLAPEPSARHRWSPDGITLAFPQCPFVTIEMRKRKPGVKLRLTGSIETLRRAGAPDGPRVDGQPGFVRVYVEQPGDIEAALEWIAAAARLRGLAA